MKQNSNLLAILLILLIIISCKEDNPVNPPEELIPAISDTLTISVEQETHRSISVNIKNTNNKTGKLIELRRLNGSNKNENYNLVFTYAAEVLDTTIIDDNDGSGLELDTEYGYYAVRLDSLNMPKDSSNIVTGKTLAATSHEYKWEEKILGEWQSVLYDVWGTDENNVYAVGSVTLNGELHGILHYDGNEWKGIKDAGGYSIYGFSENDIWVAGGGVSHFNGNEWKQVDSKTVNHHSEPLDTVLFNNTPYTSLWGTSSNNLYFACANGKIIHWNGNKASVVYEGSNVPLTDIFGIDNNFILAAGSDLADPGIGLYYKGNSWKLIEGINYSNTMLNSVFIINKKRFYVFGERNYEWDGRELNEILKDTPAVQNRLRGNEIGEIVSVGYGFSLNHYNGENWKDYSYELNKPNSAFYSVFLTTDKIFAVGGLGNYAAIYIGTRK